MVRDLPDFVTGLVNIAQRGRSLGIHLHPGHPAALRGGVRRHPGQHQPADRAAGHRPGRERRRDRRARTPRTSPSPRPGRAYVRLGHASLVPFQAGPGRRPAGPAPPAAADRPAAVAGPAGLGGPGHARSRARPAATQRGEDGDHRPDGAGRARSGRPPSGCGIPAQHSPWLPAAAEPRCCSPTCPADRRPASRAAGRRRRRVPFGLDDLPAPSRQRPAVARPGHLRPPDGGGRAAQRPVPAAAHDRRRARACATAAPTCTCTGSTAATARCCRSPTCRTAARSCSRTQTERAARLLGAAGRRAEPAAGTARRRRVRGHRRAARRARRRPGEPAAAHPGAARPLGGLHRHARRGRRRRA